MRWVGTVIAAHDPQGGDSTHNEKDLRGLQGKVLVRLMVTRMIGRSALRSELLFTGWLAIT